MTVLVTGGTGYIGSHVVRLLTSAGARVVVVDDVVTGVESRIPDVPLTRFDLAEDDAPDRLAELMQREQVESVIHLAARKQVGESMTRPAWYISQNVGGLANLLAGMRRAHVTKLVFSSSAAVYGDTHAEPIDETAETRPISPYGQTKLAGEELVEAAGRTFGLRGVSLRYFNVAGAHVPELADRAALNLVPMVFDRVDKGADPLIFGDDYPTPDGTCVRDYIHVQDLAEVHLGVLQYLEQEQRQHAVFNVGTGVGYSVREVIDMIAEVSGRVLTPEVRVRRPGDLPSVISKVDRIAATLGWRARFGLREIIESAWAAHSPVELEHHRRAVGASTE